MSRMPNSMQSAAVGVAPERYAPDCFSRASQASKSCCSLAVTSSSECLPIPYKLYNIRAVPHGTQLAAVAFTKVGKKKRLHTGNLRTRLAHCCAYLAMQVTQYTPTNKVHDARANSGRNVCQNRRAELSPCIVPLPVEV